MKQKVKKTGIVLLIFVVIAGLLFFVGRPVFIGYSTYQAVAAENYTIEEYNKIATQSKDQIANLTNFLASANQKISDAAEHEKLLNQQISDTGKQMEALKQQYTLQIQKINEDVNSLNQKIGQKDKQISDLEKAYGLLATNSAKSICCKMKIDNPDIDYFSLKSNKIICGEDGEEKLKCSFS